MIINKPNKKYIIQLLQMILGTEVNEFVSNRQ